MASPLIQGKDAINQYNLQMRSQPWYQEWFRSQGLDPNKVHLSQQQRQQLEQVALKNGAPPGLFQDMMIDPAGNLNSEHGFASQPTWLKALEIGGALAGGAVAAPGSVGGLFGMGGAPTAATPTLAGGFTPAAVTSAGVTAGPAAIAGSTVGGVSGTAGLAGLSGLGAGETFTTLGASGGLLPGAKKAGSLIGDLMDGKSNNFLDLGRAMGGLRNEEQQNRIDKGSMTQGYDRLMLSAQQDRRANETDALKKLAQTGYIGQGGSQFAPPTFQLNGQTRTAPSFPGISPLPPSEAQKTGAATLEQQMLERLKPTGSYTPTQPDYLDRGKLETAGQWGDIIGGGIGIAKNIFGF